MTKMLKLILFALTGLATLAGTGQNILPTPLRLEKLASTFTIQKKIGVAFSDREAESAKYLIDKLQNYVKVKKVAAANGDIVLATKPLSAKYSNEGYDLEVTDGGIRITAATETGLFYGIQSLLQLFPDEVQSGKNYNLAGFQIPGIKVFDKPKYGWRSFMLDSGRQYQTPDFIKRYLSYMAMLKMNMFHWHLSENMGWRVEIKKYPSLAIVGSQVAKGEQQQGYYTQEEIKDIVEYASKLHITVVPEIDVPGHSAAALTAYPEYSCFNKLPEIVMGPSADIFCAGKEKTYSFLEGVLDEICELFPSEYIHLGGDEARKENWNICPDCQSKIKEEGLDDAHELQLYFSARMANYLKAKKRKVILWGDVIYQDGYKLPDNVIIQWWNYWKKDLAYNNAIKNGYPVICNTNRYTYLNFPVTPKFKYTERRTFDMRTAYEDNPSDIENPHPLVLGMGCALWTDWYVLENQVDERVFPRIYALSEQMWNSGERLPFDEFYVKVKQKYTLLRELGIDFGPAVNKEASDK